jgi:hypothetical protein
MKCVMCQSPRMMKFIDGFGERRVFCRDCGRNFLEGNFMKILEQKSLHEFRIDTYYKIPMSR